MMTFERLGMHRAGCRASVEAELEAVSGVVYFHVDLDRQSATVIVDAEVMTIDELRQAIQLAGCTPTLEAVVLG